MRLRPLVTVLSILMLTACGGASGVGVQKSAQIADTKIIWKDIQKISTAHKAAFTLPAGEGLYMFSSYRSHSVMLSNGRTATTGSCHLAIDHSAPRVKELFNECANKLLTLERTGQKRLSQKALISRAQQAVKAEGSCQWQGYDAALDQRARAIGALAAAGDSRLFFAKLRCS